MTFTTKFIPDESVMDGLGTPDVRGYYNVDFEFLDVIEITETDPQQLVCSYSLTLNETILSYRFRFGYTFDGSNATAEAAEEALNSYLNEMYMTACG